MFIIYTQHVYLTNIKMTNLLFIYQVKSVDLVL